MHRAGIKQAQDFIRKHLPDEFETTLTVNGCWKMPYRFTKPAGTIIVSDQPPAWKHRTTDEAKVLVQDGKRLSAQMVQQQILPIQRVMRE